MGGAHTLEQMPLADIKLVCSFASAQPSVPNSHGPITVPGSASQLWSRELLSLFCFFLSDTEVVLCCRKVGRHCEGGYDKDGCGGCGGGLLCVHNDQNLPKHHQSQTQGLFLN